MSATRTNVMRLVPPLELLEDEPAVVAEILADGSIRSVHPTVRSRIHEAKPEWSTGQLSNGHWTLWWQRRSS